MQKPFVGFFSNYDASEQTLFTMFLAQYLLKCYRYVCWFVPESHTVPTSRGKGFSHQWDRLVIPFHQSSQTWVVPAKKCGVFFFLQPNEALLDVLPKEATKILVLNSVLWSDRWSRFAEKCDLVWSVSRCHVKAFRKKLKKPALFFPYDCMIDCVPRCKTPFFETPSVIFPVFGATVRRVETARSLSRKLKQIDAKIRTSVIGFNPLSPSSAGLDFSVFDWRFRKYLYAADMMVDFNPDPVYTFLPSAAQSYQLRWLGSSVPVYQDLFSQPSDDSEFYDGSSVCPSCSTSATLCSKEEQTARTIYEFLRTPGQSIASEVRLKDLWRDRRIQFVKSIYEILGIRTRTSVHAMLSVRKR
jgi:hypothetical protein